MNRPGFDLDYSRIEAFISSPFSDRGRPLETRGSDIGADSTHVNRPRRRPLCGETLCFVSLFVFVMMIRTTMIRIMMIGNSMISIVSLLILVLWPFRVLISGLFANDKHSFYERYSSTDTRYLSTDGQLVGPSAWLQSIPSIPVCLPLHRLFHTVSHTQTLHKLSIITY